jgi:uncharacterized protein
MKFLLLFFIFMVLLWQWRNAREQKVNMVARKTAPTPVIVDMVPCAHCGVQLPINDALRGEKGLYCSTEHRRAQEP